ncbi:hypothetical protein PC39_03432 [Salinisphaera sp. PC39]|uniref:DUF4398 domain-containing protein n=1 Tax=Salinisphaera sp. PC39 TaxID=1304156 RepID=UPI00334163CA
MGMVPEFRHVAGLVLAACLLAACAETPHRVPAPPDLSPLSEAEAMLERAREAGADRLAPEPLREGRRRLAAARDILFRAATEAREPNEAERRRVRRLADEAYLDARLALARTQRVAVDRKLAELESELSAADSGDSP